jgi:hypothetical protein
MQTVNHKKFGIGEVINKEVKESGTYITVRFSGGKEILMAIPESFEKEGIEAIGSLKEEVDKAITDKKEREEKLRFEREAAKVVAVSIPVIKAKRTGRKPASKIKVKGSIQTKYEAYLEAAGYPVVGVSGNDSTVPAYSRAVEKVIENEGISCVDLEKNIANIVAKYDVCGEFEDIGNKSNKTVINALKRFAEFVESGTII